MNSFKYWNYNENLIHEKETISWIQYFGNKLKANQKKIVLAILIIICGYFIFELWKGKENLLINKIMIISGIVGSILTWIFCFFCIEDNKIENDCLNLYKYDNKYNSMPLNIEQRNKERQFYSDPIRNQLNSNIPQFKVERRLDFDSSEVSSKNLLRAHYNETSIFIKVVKIKFLSLQIHPIRILEKIEVYF